jgi:predicted RNA binding protein YcfA (HicA-like mRNA interferase family)
MKHGFIQVRQTGSHIIMRRQLPDRGITVPVPNHPELARGTLKALSIKAKYHDLNSWLETHSESD